MVKFEYEVYCKGVIKLKKIFSLILVLSMVLCTLSLVEMTASAEADGYFTYSIFNGEATITDYSPSLQGDVIIPSELGGYPVTKIGDDAFYGCSSITSIIIPDCVTSIGSSAFDECKSLVSVYIPNSVSSIGDRAFSGCSLLESIIIPDNVTYIDSYTFYDCSSLTSIVIPANVKNIGRFAFYKCTSLSSIIISEGVTNIGASAFRKCSSLSSVVIPNTVTKIDAYAFYECYFLISVSVSNAVETVGKFAFAMCSRIENVYYEGTEEKWQTIDFAVDNECLTNANINFICEYVAILKLPEKLKYSYEEALDLTGGEIVVGYYDGTTVFENITVDMVSGFDESSGFKTLTVNYGGKQTQFSIIVYRNPDIDHNGNVSATDIAILRKSVLVSDNNEDYDLNVDGSLDVLDLVHIKKAAS